MTTLPQTDASSLVDAREIELRVRALYGEVAREEHAGLHFASAARSPSSSATPPRCSTPSPPRRSPRSPASGTTSTSPRSRPASACSTSAPAPAPTSSARPCKAGAGGAVTGVDFTPEQLVRAARLGRSERFAHVDFRWARIGRLPFADETFDVVMSNGVINLSVVKQRVFEEAARVLRPGGRFAVSDIVSGKPLKERTRRNTDLWAACIAGAIPCDDYVAGIEAAGLELADLHGNDTRSSPSGRATRARPMR